MWTQTSEWASHMSEAQYPLRKPGWSLDPLPTLTVIVGRLLGDAVCLIQYSPCSQRDSCLFSSSGLSDSVSPRGTFGTYIGSPLSVALSSAAMWYPNQDEYCTRAWADTQKKTGPLLSVWGKMKGQMQSRWGPEAHRFRALTHGYRWI